jgi:hypothetical protein
MVAGVKSKYFGCYWQTMFLSAMVYPDKINVKDPLHVKKRREFKRYYGSLKYVLGCKFCREFIKLTLEKRYPLDYSGRIALMKSIYIWKKAVSNKLIKSGCEVTKPSPKFSEILKKYEAMRAKCDKKVGKCI